MSAGGILIGVVLAVAVVSFLRTARRRGWLRGDGPDGDWSDWGGDSDGGGDGGGD